MGDDDSEEDFVDMFSGSELSWNKAYFELKGQTQKVHKVSL